MIDGLNWIAVDWGTSRCRAWAIGAGEVLAQTQSGDGMGTLERDGFEPALLRLIGPWLGADPVEVIACGMVGSRQGWAEAPYRTVPCTPTDGTTAPAPAQDPRLTVRLIPGLRQLDPADVMRGEETQIAGWLAQNPDFDGILCLPGTHTKWAQISAGEVVSFRTFMTGDLYAAISDHTVLRHSVGDGWDDGAFADALDTALAKPEALATRLFAIRAEGLLAGVTPGAGAARLSGLLIGAELAAARPYWLGQNVAILGGTSHVARYATALSHQGVTARAADADTMTRAGLAAARQHLTESA
ncbi:MAG: 2-dehydro-3-deoxygalactonokinase [Pseudomonadota bacterium]